MAEDFSIPEGSKWPIIGAISLFFVAIGAINWVHGDYRIGHYFVLGGAIILAFMLFGWFREVIREGNKLPAGSTQMTTKFKHGMFWFIFTEFMFFFAFFFALFYARLISVPELGALTSPTHLLLWPNFSDLWPVLQNPSSEFVGAKEVVNPWHIPLLNTIVLFISDMALTWAYVAICRNRRKQMLVFMIIAFVLTLLFLGLQINEFTEAYTVKDIMLKSGIYGATFISLTGIHAVHILIGLSFLIVIIGRGFHHHFSADHHFAVTAVSWYWHFLDALWLAVFVFVYWL